MPATARTIAPAEAGPAAKPTITATAFVGQHAPSLPTTQARRRPLAEIPRSANNEQRRRAENPVTMAAAALEKGLSRGEFWLCALSLNLVFWLWALYGA